MKLRLFTTILLLTLLFLLTLKDSPALGQEGRSTPVEHTGGDVLLARANNGMLTWQFDPDTNTWSELVALSPPWSDALGWDDVDNYSTIQTADVDGDGAAELLARANNGMLTWKFDPQTNTWSELVALSPPWSDALGWNIASHYWTIQAADVDGDGAAELLARGDNGMLTWKFHPGINTWSELAENSPPWSNASGWHEFSNYSTIQTADVDGDGAAELLARSDDGMLTWKFDTQTNTWYELVANSPPWSNALGWYFPDLYTTIQTADVDGDGAAELLARGDHGILTWKFNSLTNTWSELVVNSPPWSDALGWDDPANYWTIQTADVDGDGAAELLARSDNGMLTWKFDGHTNTWYELAANSPPWSDAQGWIYYYTTIQTADVDGDGTAELLSRASHGMLTWKFNVQTNTWYELATNSPPWSDVLGWDDYDNYTTIQTAKVEGPPFKIYLPIILNP